MRLRHTFHKQRRGFFESIKLCIDNRVGPLYPLAVAAVRSFDEEVLFEVTRNCRFTLSESHALASDIMQFELARGVCRSARMGLMEVVRETTGVAIPMLPSSSPLTQDFRCVERRHEYDARERMRTENDVFNELLYQQLERDYS